MQIAFVGLDEVNRYLARKWLRRLAAGIQLRDVQTIGVSSVCSVIVVDLDSLPPPHRHRWIGWLTSFACKTPALVFGHTINDQESDALRSCGVRVVPRALKRSTLHRWIERELTCAA